MQNTAKSNPSHRHKGILKNMSRNVPQILWALIFSCGWYFLGSLLIRFSFHSLIYRLFDVAVYGFPGSSRSSFDFFVFFLLDIKRNTFKFIFCIFDIIFGFIRDFLLEILVCIYLKCLYPIKERLFFGQDLLLVW